MGSLLIEPIISYDAKNITDLAITANRDNILSAIFPLKDTWIFPWHYKHVMTNIEHIHFPTNCIGLIKPVDTKHIVSQPIIYGDELKSVSIRTTGILPKKLKKGEPFIYMMTVRAMECHITGR